MDKDGYDGWRPVTADAWLAEENEALGIRHAIYLFDGTHIDDTEPRDDWRTYLRSYTRIRVLDVTGVEEFRTIEIPYTRRAKIREIKARTVKPDGTVIEIGKKDIYDKDVLSFRKFRIREKVAAFKNLEPGDIVELRYTLELPAGSTPMLHLRKRHYVIDTEVLWYPRPAIELSPQYRAEFADFIHRPAWLLTGMREFVGGVEMLPDDRHPDHLRVHYTNIPPLPDEPYMPPEDQIAAYFVGGYQYPNRDAKKPFWERVAESAGKGTAKS